MEYYTNHCWCSKSNWDDDFFDCRYLITLDRDVDEEFDDLLKTEWHFDKESYDYHFTKLHKDFPSAAENLDKNSFYNDYLTLNDIVFKWLLENVEDNKEGKTWCIGNEKYLSNGDNYKFNLFFKRRKDAMAFVKHWSKYKKPTTYFDYFRDKRKELNPDTGKYTITER